MPTVTKKRGRLRVRASKMVRGRILTRWFGDRNEKVPLERDPEYRLALTWEAQAKEKLNIQAQARTETPSGSAILDLCTAHLRDVAAKKAESTFKEHKRSMDLFVAYFGPETTFEDILVDPETGEMVIADLQEFVDEWAEAVSGYFANHKLMKNLKTAWNWWCRHAKRFPRHLTNPFTMLDRHKEVRTPTYVPPLGDFWKVYDSVDGRDAAAFQDRLMLLHLLHLAARPGEVFNARKEHVDLERKRIAICTMKRQGGDLEWDFLPLTADLRQGLAWWLDNHPVPEADHLYLVLERTPFCEPYYSKPFSGRQHWLKRQCGRAGVRPFNYRGVRPLTAQHLHESGYPVEHIQAVLRHQNITTTRTYLRKLGVKVIRETVEQGMPRREGGRVLVFPPLKMKPASVLEAGLNPPVEPGILTEAN